MPSSSPSRSSTRTTVPQIQVMSPPRPGGGGGGKPRREPRDTGFPEPFDEGRNTTLPHPEADLSPNASISQEEVAVDRALKRRRLFFLNKHKKTISHGLITPQMEALHSVQSLAATAKGLLGRLRRKS
ncbi:hypothetical protein CDD83_5463 [Cordyceps sp. RAO-2017]|nr:hypothetical protein CDD83_5463 [Cordyceps sp. RAO-2017]